MTNEERQALIAQGWTPPVTVDPDLAEANRVYKAMDWPDGLSGDIHEFYVAFIYEGIKRGRELERAEAKPGMVWIKHDGSARCPVHCDVRVLVKYERGHEQTGFRAAERQWVNVTHYAIITQPEDAA